MCRIIPIALALLPALACADPWPRHVIDDSVRGVDGVDFGDFDLDGDDQWDVVTSCQEAGLVGVYLHPGPEKTKDRWPAVTVGRVGDPAHAVFAHLDRDLIPEVVTCCEGETQAIFIHRLTDPNRPLDETAWKTERIAAADGWKWMRCFPFGPGPGLHEGRPLIVGSKGQNGIVAALYPPLPKEKGRAEWRLVPIQDAGWVMSIEPLNRFIITAPPLIVSDRKGPRRGIYLLEPDRLFDPEAKWTRIDLGGREHEPMFLDNGASWRIVAATADGPLLRFVPTYVPGSREYRHRPDGYELQPSEGIPLPDGVGTGKTVLVRDVNGDKRDDILVSCENAKDKIGVFWLEQHGPHDKPEWRLHDISGPEGAEFDHLATPDVDGDGDRDVLTCEGREGLGVIWYENLTH